MRQGASRTEIEALGKAVAEAPLGELARMRVTAVSVMKSDLKPGGAVYTELYRAPLSAEEEG